MTSIAHQAIVTYNPDNIPVFWRDSQPSLRDRCTQSSSGVLNAFRKFAECARLSCQGVDVECEVGPFCLVWSTQEGMVGIDFRQRRNFRVYGLDMHGVVS